MSTELECKKCDAEGHDESTCTFKLCDLYGGNSDCRGWQTANATLRAQVLANDARMEKLDKVLTAARRLLEGFDDGKDVGRMFERRSDLRVALTAMGYGPRPYADRVTNTVDSVPLELTNLHASQR